jgi:arylsulfatase A-like enzyme
LERLGFTGGSDCGGKHDAVQAALQGIAEPYSDFLRRHGLLKLYTDDFAHRPSPNYANVDPSPLPDFAYGDNWVGAEALRLMTEAEASDDPWFLQVNFFGPHEPLDVPRSLIEALSDRDFGIPDTLGDLKAHRQRAIRRRYAAMIENIDRWLATAVAMLAQNGTLDNTVIVFTSDHGDMLGDRGLWAKQTPYQPSVGIPLVMAGPGIPEGALCREVVSNVDFGATFLDIAGLGADWRDGVSVLSAAQENLSQTRVAGYGCWRSVHHGPWKLIVGYTPETTPPTKDDTQFHWIARQTPVQLFNLDADPQERTDLSIEEPARVADMLLALGIGAR